MRRLFFYQIKTSLWVIISLSNKFPRSTIRTMIKPGLFGITNSNRDFTQADAWGKNQFNASFPASLVCYMSHKKLEPVYLNLDSNAEVIHSFISPTILFGQNYEKLFFAFESDFPLYRQLVIGNLPRVDLVTQNNGQSLAALEVKLTALPDETTYNLSEEHYGCELVIRPDTIVYIALQIASRSNRNELLNILGTYCTPIHDWTEPSEVLPQIPGFVQIVESIIQNQPEAQLPLLLQPVWKTIKKSMVLAEDCLDVFVWSNFALTRLFGVSGQIPKTIDRPTRALVWLIKMLYEFSQHGRFNPRVIIDTLTYNTKNDKAFSASGRKTQPFMRSPQLLTPRIRKDEIRNIILGGGEKLGSGSKLTDTREVIVHDKTLENNLVHRVRFGEGEGFANKTS
jgi:HindVP restriction endonuclease